MFSGGNVPIMEFQNILRRKCTNNGVFAVFRGNATIMELHNVFYRQYPIMEFHVFWRQGPILYSFMFSRCNAQ